MRAVCPRRSVFGRSEATKKGKGHIKAFYGEIDNTPEPRTLHFHGSEDMKTYIDSPHQIPELGKTVKELKESVRKLEEDNT